MKGIDPDNLRIGYEDLRRFMDVMKEKDHRIADLVGELEHAKLSSIHYVLVSGQDEIDELERKAKYLKGLVDSLADCYHRLEVSHAKLNREKNELEGLFQQQRDAYNTLRKKYEDQKISDARAVLKHPLTGWRH